MKVSGLDGFMDENYFHSSIVLMAAGKIKLIFDYLPLMNAKVSKGFGLNRLIKLIPTTVVPGFSFLGFRALPGFRAL